MSFIKRIFNRKEIKAMSNIKNSIIERANAIQPITVTGHQNYIAVDTVAAAAAQWAHNNKAALTYTGPSVAECEARANTLGDNLAEAKAAVNTAWLAMRDACGGEARVAVATQAGRALDIPPELEAAHNRARKIVTLLSSDIATAKNNVVTASQSAKVREDAAQILAQVLNVLEGK